MMRFFLGFLAFGALIAASILVLPSFVSSEWMRAELSRKLSTATGSSIALNGPVRLSVFPHMAVVAETVVLSSEEAGVTAEIGEVAGSVTLSSLWSDRLHIKEIRLVQPILTLHEKTGKASPTEGGKLGRAKPGDPLAALVTFLERSAIDSVSVVSGTLRQQSTAGAKQVITDIDLSLAVPDIDDQLSLSASARIEERRYQMTLAISSVRPLLERQPADLSLSFEADPAPAPGLSAFEATGQVALNTNGSYQIRGGKLLVGDEALGLDALFIPGNRPRFLADIDADRLDLSAFLEATTSASSQPNAKSEKSGASTGLQLLTGFDADIGVNIRDLVLGDISASDVALAATLKDGLVTARIEHLGIDAGSVAANISVDIREVEPTFKGRISSSGLDVAKVANLTGQSVPLTGSVTIDTRFAFRGLSGDALRKTINMTGSLGLHSATFIAPGVADPSLSEVKIKKLALRIDDFAKPGRLSGSLAWRGKPAEVDLQLPLGSLLAGDLNSGGIPLKLDMRMPGAALSLDGKAAIPNGYAGKLIFSTADVRGFLGWLGQSGPDNIDLFAFNGDVSASPASVQFESATLSVNGVEGTGSGSVQFTTPLKISSALKFAQLDFARLAGARSSAPQSKAQGADPAPDAPLDFSSLRLIDASINVNADKLGYGNVFAGPVATTLTVADGVASLSLPESPFYGGHITASLRADGSGSEPSIALNASITGASAAPLLTDMAGFRHLEGALQAKLDITGAGSTTGTLKQSLQGSADVRFSDGAIRGIDIADAYNNLVGLMSSGFKQNESQATGFTELSASFAVDSGVARTEDIKLIGPLVRMNGTGEANLADGQMKFRLDPRVVASLDGQGAEISTDGIGVPVLIEGPFARPRIYPDLSGLLKNPTAALATLKKFGLPTDTLRIDDLLSDKATGGSLRDIVGGAIDKTLKGERNQPSIEEIIDGNVAQSGEAPPDVQADEDPATLEPAARQPVPGAEQPDQDAGTFGNLFNRLLQ
ncbi:AsmA family protein [Ensifer canadensis]|uniref:AsmA family protein n=1 Tax=Ensifer canadensis TaxID=555315 RepID=UPI0035E3E11F